MKTHLKTKHILIKDGYTKLLVRLHKKIARSKRISNKQYVFNEYD